MLTDSVQDNSIGKNNYFWDYSLQMPRKQNLNKVYLRWDENDMNRAISSAMEGNLSILGTTQLCNVPYSTLHGKVNMRKEMTAGLNPVVKRMLHLMLLSLEMEQAVVERLICLEESGLGQTPTGSTDSFLLCR